MSLSTSDGVRYSRGRNSLLLGRVGVRRRVRTDRFSLLGRTNCRCAVIGLFPRCLCPLTGQSVFSGHLTAEKERAPKPPSPLLWRCCTHSIGPDINVVIFTVEVNSLYGAPTRTYPRPAISNASIRRVLTSNRRMAPEAARSAVASGSYPPASWEGHRLSRPPKVSQRQL